MAKLDILSICLTATLGLLGSAGGLAAQPCGSDLTDEAAALYPLPDKGKWGFVGADGEWRLAPQWRQVRPFSEGLAAVESQDGWGLITQDGTYVVEPRARDSDRVVISGTEYTLSPYKPMSEGCSAATPAGETPHYVMASGDKWEPEALKDREVLDLGSFSEGLAWVRLRVGVETRVGWIDTGGAMVIKPEFMDGGDFAEGRAPAALGKENRGYIDGSGELVFPRKFILQSAGPYAEGRAPVRLNGDVGFMAKQDWAFRAMTQLDGQTRPIEAAAPFHDGRAAVRPGPVWVNTEGAVAVDPQRGARLSICNETRMPRYHAGLLPLVVGDGTNICGNTPEVSYEGPGDPRNGPEQMLWHLPWRSDKLVWLDRDGRTVIDSTDCRRAPGVAALPVRTDGGGLAEGAYHLSAVGTVTAESGPFRADAPCNLSEFEMDGNTATNAGGPWSLSLHGSGTWQDKPVDMSLSLGLPAGIGAGVHEVGATGKDDFPSAYLWMSAPDMGPEADQPATYTSKSGTLTLDRRDREAISGRLEIALVSRDDPADRVTVSARFNTIPYTAGPEVTMVETTGAVTALDESMPDDPLINFFTPATAVEDGDSLVLSLGKFGPKLELIFPADHDGAFTAGPEAPVSISFAGVPVSADGTLTRAGETLSGDLTARLGAHGQVNGAGSVTLRFAAVPVERAE